MENNVGESRTLSPLQDNAYEREWAEKVATFFQSHNITSFWEMLRKWPHDWRAAPDPDWWIDVPADWFATWPDTFPADRAALRYVRESSPAVG